MKNFEVLMAPPDQQKEAIHAVFYSTSEHGELVFYDTQDREIATYARGMWVRVKEHSFESQTADCSQEA